MLVFTSCLANYLPKARILGKSLKKIHPDWTFVLVLGEPWPLDEPQTEEPFDRIVYYEELGIKDLTAWLFRHSIVEICTAVKGFAVCHFFEKYQSDKVIYLDPDIQVFNSLEDINRLLDRYDILLVPHHLKPHDDLNMIVSNELCQMRHGIYNLGFAAFARRAEGIACARWWRDRLYHFCRNDVASGLFTDQRWCDFIPSFFDNYHIIKDPGYDVASWNLTDRRLWKDQNGVVYADSSPVKFYHFTGYDSGAGRSVIAHYTEEMPVVADLWDAYDKQHKDNGQDRLHHHAWPFDYFQDGTKITQHMRDIYRERDDLQKVFPDPFSTEPKNNYLSWYRTNVVEPSSMPEADSARAFTDSYSWKVIGRTMYHLECRFRDGLRKSRWPNRALRKVLLMFRDRFRGMHAAMVSKSKAMVPLVMILTLSSLCFEIPAEAAKRLLKKRSPKKKLFNQIRLVHASSFHQSERVSQVAARPAVLFDLFFCRGIHGGGEYGKSVFLSLCEKVAQDEITLYVAARLDNDIEDYCWETIVAKNINVIPVSCYDEVTSLVNTAAFDYFFTPALVVYTGYVYQCRCGEQLEFQAGRTKVIGVIHDIRDVELALERKRYVDFRKSIGLLPENDASVEELSKRIQLSLEEADNYTQMYRSIFENDAVFKIITVSNYSMETIKTLLNNDGGKMLALYAPMRKRIEPQGFRIEGRDPAGFDFALMINAGRWEKNAAGAIVAFDRYCDDAPRLRFTFLILGVGGFHELGIPRVNHPERFIFLNGFIENSRLEYLYSKAAFLVYPSFGEGFGYPPIEIMAYGTPSLVSDKSAIPEICGDAAVYCDPYDIASIQTGFGKIIDSPPTKEALHSRYRQIVAKQQQDLEKLTSLFKHPG